MFSSFSASPRPTPSIKRVIIYVYNFLFTDIVLRNWGATHKFQTMTSYKL